MHINASLGAMSYTCSLLVHLTSVRSVHDTEQEDRDYLQLHNDRTTLLLTNLITTSVSQLTCGHIQRCTPDDG
jgi:hypothetical protein